MIQKIKVVDIATLINDKNSNNNNPNKSNAQKRLNNVQPIGDSTGVYP